MNYGINCRDKTWREISYSSHVIRVDLFLTLNINEQYIYF